MPWTTAFSSRRHSPERARRTKPAAHGKVAQRDSIVASANGQTMMLDCQRHQEWWSGVVKVRDASADRVVHVCTELRKSTEDALRDADQAAQRLALMFAQ